MCKGEMARIDGERARKKKRGEREKEKRRERERLINDRTVAVKMTDTGVNLGIFMAN